MKRTDVLKRVMLRKPPEIEKHIVPTLVRQAGFEFYCTKTREVDGNSAKKALKPTDEYVF